MSARRKLLVDLAFDSMDIRGRNTLEPQIITQKFNPFQHPDVLSGERTPQEALQAFTDSFDVGGKVAGKVTRDEFNNYYANLSCSIPNDDYFEVLVRNTWGLPATRTRPDSPKHKSNNNKLGQTSLLASTSSTPAARLAAPAPSLMNQLVGNAPVQRNGIAVNNVIGDTIIQKPSPVEIAIAGPNAAVSAQLISNVVVRKSSVRPTSAPAGARGLRPTSASINRPTSGATNALIANNAGPTIDPGIALILTKLKADIRSRGIHGFNELQRMFWLMDEDHSQELSLPEFTKAMTELEINMTSREFRLMFESFDKDHSGSIQFDEFMNTLRDPPTPQRLSLIQTAFNKLDKQGQGLLSAEYIALMYDPTGHPEVMAGRISAQDCHQDFLESFDLGREVEGAASQREFLNYYANLGACISNDDYFELLLTGTWKIPENSQRNSSSSSPGSGLVNRIRGQVSEGWY